MPKIVLALIASALLSTGCAVRVLTVPDPSVPHRVAEPARVKVWVRSPDGTLTKQEVRLEEGWWVASPVLIEK